MAGGAYALCARQSRAHTSGPGFARGGNFSIIELQKVAFKLHCPPPFPLLLRVALTHSDSSTRSNDPMFLAWFMYRHLHPLQCNFFSRFTTRARFTTFPFACPTRSCLGTRRTMPSSPLLAKWKINFSLSPRLTVRISYRTPCSFEH